MTVDAASAALGGRFGVAALAGVLVWLLARTRREGRSRRRRRPAAVPRASATPSGACDDGALRAIDATLDRFVPLAIGRRDPEAARAYVTPNLRSQASPAEWRPPGRPEARLRPSAGVGSRFGRRVTGPDGR